MSSDTWFQRYFAVIRLAWPHPFDHPSGIKPSVKDFLT
jgi:hypothetical protein